jgi:hypothetical protein
MTPAECRDLLIRVFGGQNRDSFRFLASEAPPGVSLSEALEIAASQHDEASLRRAAAEWKATQP